MRQIEKKMIAFIDTKLSGNGLAQEAIKRKDARTVMIEAAKACVGIKEKSGKNDGPMVELIQETVGSHSQEFWCMSFVMTCIAYAEVKTGVKSPLTATEHCVTLWNKTPEDQRVKYLPKAGAIAIWQYGKTTNGHTDFVMEADAKEFTGIGGNTSGSTDSKGSTRNGNGVYWVKRAMAGKGTMKLKGFIKPF